MDIHKKRDSNMKEPSTNIHKQFARKNTTTNFITIVIYYITKNLQINLILKVSSPHRESPRDHDQCPVPQSPIKLTLD